MQLREVQAALAWSGLPFVGERSLLALFNHALETRRGLAELWEAPLEDRDGFLKLHPRARAALADRPADLWQQAGADAGAARSRGVDVLLALAPDFPSALRETPRPWPLLFAYGALELLEEPRVAIVNSRSPSTAALTVTDALADALARRDVALVTSTNKEAYQAAAVAAKRHAGPALLVLDRGIAEAFPAGLEREPVPAARVWDEQFDPDLQLLLSPFGWRERWNPRSGPRRDALLFDLADLIVAVDVNPGGTMDRECRLAAEHGKPVYAVDLPDRPSTGTASLWETGGADRLPWRGAEDAAQAILRRLPGEGPSGNREDAARRGWDREVAQFLARTCAALEREPRRATAAYPANGVFAQAAAAWSPRGADGTAGASWLLADLTAEKANSRRLEALLQRVTPGGLVAAVLPAAWLDNPTLAKARSAWLQQAALRAAVRLPDPAGKGMESPPTAAVILQRGTSAPDPTLTFSPAQERMGRFHLRRYLHEVTEALTRSCHSPSPPP